MKKAFTLAEVLITLTIIGVIAALTIPNLMTKYQQHVFENQFKKSLYTMSQIVAQTKSSLGVSRLEEYCSTYDANKGYYNTTECLSEINLHMKKALSNKNTKIQPTLKIPYDTDRIYETLKTYNNKNSFTMFDGAVYTIYYTNKLVDGSFLSASVANYTMFISVDTNGSKKPNRLGYDIFIFSLNRQNDAISGFKNQAPTNSSDDDASTYADTYYGNHRDRNYRELVYGTPCNLDSTRSSNGIGCAYYALRNKCPYDDTKTYWECLK